MLNQVSEFSIQYHKNFSFETLPKMLNASSCVKVLREVWENDLNHIERFYMLGLNRANQVINVSLISMGGLSATVVDGKVLFQKALLSNSSSIIIAHNHPSGQCFPSDSDKAITRKFVEFGKYIDLQVLDHIILTENSFFSFADNELI
jgi:DNA repair protein RadC